MINIEQQNEIVVVRPKNNFDTNKDLTNFELANLQSSAHEYTDKKGGEQLFGAINQSDLESGSYKSWFESGYNQYKPDAKLIEQLRPKLADNSIKIIMATWCVDTQRDVPIFLKILDEAEFPKSQLQIIAVKHDKKIPGGKKIAWVPTFIISRNGQEKGQIGERPGRGQEFEKDLLALVS